MEPDVCQQEQIQKLVSLKRSMRVWSVGTTLLLLLSSNNLLKAAATCEPALVWYTPTPAIEWNQVDHTDLVGYKIYYSHYGINWIDLASVPCERLGDEEPYTRFCRGVDKPIPLQRYCPQCLEFKRWYFCVVAYTSNSTQSVSCSNTLSVCMPHIWVPNEPYN
jgi:hypothetical protein